MNENLDLFIGKPVVSNPDRDIKEKIATFTRFVLPFAFWLQPAQQTLNQENLFYVLDYKKDLPFIKRRKYFTRETADTLYGRAQWLTMCDAWEQTAWGKAEIKVTLRDREFNLGMLPPNIVLFELPEIKIQQESNILQTGFLYVDVYFSKQQNNSPQLDDLLVLNEFFRYFGIPYDSHAEIFKKIFSNVPIKPNKDETIASLGMLERYFERWAEFLEIPIRHQNQYYQLFPKTPPDDWAKAARDWMYNKPTDKKAEHWQIYSDNRCYVWTVAFLEKGGDSLRTEFGAKKTKLEAKDYGHWIKLLNVDNPPFDFASEKYKAPSDTHKSSQFERQWTKQRIYKRWEEDGSWYGFCYHCTAILAPPISFIFSPSATYYFDTTMLLLYIRMTLFRFSNDLSNAIQDIQNVKTATEKFRQLRREFSTFTVLYQFPMLSNQQQSMEMYEINRKALEIDQFFEEIQHEIDNVHEFHELVEANKIARSADNLAKWGIPLATGGLITAIFGMTDFNIWKCVFKEDECTINPDYWFQTIITVFIAFIAGFLVRHKQ